SLDAEVQEDGTYGLPSLEAWKSFSPSDTVGLGIGGQAGYLFSENADASGTYIRPYAFADWAFGINATAFARAAFESLDSRNDYYSYVAPRLEVGLDFTVGEAEFTPLVSVTSTR